MFNQKIIFLNGLYQIYGFNFTALRMLCKHNKMYLESGLLEFFSLFNLVNHFPFR